MKAQTPKNLYARTLAKGKISVGEYVRAKWNNVCDPIDPSKPEEIRSFWALVATFEQRTGRAVELVGYHGDSQAVEILKKGKDAQ